MITVQRNLLRWDAPGAPNFLYQITWPINGGWNSSPDTQKVFHSLNTSALGNGWMFFGAWQSFRVFPRLVSSSHCLTSLYSLWCKPYVGLVLISFFFLADFLPVFKLLDLATGQISQFHGKYGLKIVGGGATYQSIADYTEDEQIKYNYQTTR